MAKRNRPEETGFPRMQLVRAYPSLIGVSNGQRATLEEMAKAYTRFVSKALVPSQVVDEVLDLAMGKGYVSEREALERAQRRRLAPGESRTLPFYVTGPDDKSFALVRPGKPLEVGIDPLENGLRILASHVDSPCLIAKQRPLFFQWDPDEKELYPGVMVDMYQYGGTKPYQWGDLPVMIIGTGVRKGRRYEKSLTGTVIGHSAHLDKRGPDTTLAESFSQEAIKVFTGHESRRALLRELGFDREDDFFTTSWYAVPRISPTRLGDFIAAYGHDDRSCTFAAVHALFQAKRTSYTTVVVGFDWEEVFSQGAGGAKDKFLEKIINTVRKVVRSKYSSEEVIQRSIAISADVDVAPGPQELESKGNVDVRNVARLGYGVSVYNPTGLEGGYNSPLDFKYYIKEMLRKANIPNQLLGTGEPADYAVGLETIGRFFSGRGLTCLDAGTPIAGSHGITELLYLGDLFRTQQFYQTFLEESRPYRRIHKRR